MGRGDGLIVRRPSLLTGEACPTCGAPTLHFAYVGNQVNGAGYGALWCTTSNDGITTGRAEFPADVPVVPFGDHDTVPNFNLVQATDPDGDDGGIYEGYSRSPSNRT